MTGKKRDPKPSNHGIALVIVLGFMAVLTVIVVGLAVYTRTERIVANFALEEVRVMEYARMALHESIRDINGYMNTSPAMYYPDFKYITTTTTGTNKYGKKINNSIREYIPQFVRPSDADFINMAWIDIKNNLNEVVGRYAYAISDCSGFLDVNVIGRKDHTNGIWGEEIQTSALDSSLADTNVLNWRAMKIRYDTVIEMAGLKYSGNTDVKNLCCYSYFPPRKLPNGITFLSASGTNAYPIMIDQETADLETIKNDITNAFVLCSVSNFNNSYDMLFDNLIDYVDTNSIPKDVDSFCTEAVPMITEVVLTNEIVVTPEVVGVSPTTYSNKIIVTVETWYPFDKVPTDSGFTNAACIIPGYTLIDVPLPFTPAPNSFNKSTFVYGRYLDTTPTPPSVDINPFYFEVYSGTSVVDRATIREPLTFYNGNYISFTCDDPRLNWQTNYWTQLSGINSTLGTTNNLIGYDVYDQWYVRDNKIENVAELGSLSVGIPWETIHLSSVTPSQKIDPVLDYFMTSVETNTRHGLCNVNTHWTNVLASLFAGAGIRESFNPSASLASTVSVAMATIMATNIILTTKTVATNDSISVIGTAFNGLTLNERERESIIANCYRLLSPRQNMFSIFIVAQSGNSKSGPFVPLSEKKAIALIWRDPYPNADGINPCFVRYMYWVEVED